MSKNKFNKLVLSMACSIVLLKLNVKLLEKQTSLQKMKIKIKELYLNFKVGQNDQKSCLLLNITRLKLILR